MSDEQRGDPILARAERLRAEIERQRPLMIGGKPHYIVEWDLVLSRDRLATYTLQRAAREVVPAPEEPSDRLLAATTPDHLVMRWRPGLVLTYAVLEPTFLTPGLYGEVRANIAQAAREWEQICGVQFMHLQALDGGVDPAGLQPLFTVQEFQRPDFYALAFFPNAEPAARVIFVDGNYLRAPHDRVGIMRHELGHVLGFRHEHIRSENPAGHRAELDEHLTTTLGDYDPHSVMHYPPEGRQATFQLTEFDKRGAQFVYGGPLSTFENFLAEGAN